MSKPGKHLGSPDPFDGLLLRIADQIAPLFQNIDSDPAYARKAAISAIAAYHPQSRADIVSIGRILAFSMATLAALGIAAADDLPPAQKMRYFGRANALNRSADQTERLMIQRRRTQPADLPPKPRAADAAKPEQAPPPDAAADELFDDDAVIKAAVEETMAAFRATQPPHKTVPPHSAPQPSVSHHAARFPHPATDQPAKTSYRQSLLQRTAIQSVIAAGQPPG